MSSSWTDKYKPKNIKSVIGNEQELNKIIQWIEEFESRKKIKKNKKSKLSFKITEENNTDSLSEIVKNKKNKKILSNSSSLLITGDNGVGKTFLIKCVIEHLNMQLIEITLKTLSYSKDIEELINNILNSSDIYNILAIGKTNKKIILIDEVETFFSNNDKLFIQMLLKYNQQLWKYPIILISNNQHNKLNNYIKTIAYEIKINHPSHNNMMDLLMKVCYDEKIKLYDESIAKTIIDKSQSDYRQLLFTLQDISTLYNTIITKDIIDCYYSFSHNKGFEADIFKITSKLFQDNNNYNEIENIYEFEKTLIPLMIQQNYVNYYNNYNIDKLIDIADAISVGDIIENYIYEDQNWELKDIHCFYSCSLPIYNIIKNKKYKQNIYKLDFPVDLNRTSIKRINNRNIKNANKYLNNMNIYDYIYLTNYIQLINNNNDSFEYNKILAKYKIKNNIMDSIIKINKLQKK